MFTASSPCQPVLPILRRISSGRIFLYSFHRRLVLRSSGRSEMEDHMVRTMGEGVGGDMGRSRGRKSSKRTEEENKVEEQVSPWGF